MLEILCCAIAGALVDATSVNTPPMVFDARINYARL
jgi:hypothetical protein